MKRDLKICFLRNVLEEWRWTFSSTVDSWKEALVLFFWTASPSYDVAYDVYAFLFLLLFNTKIFFSCSKFARGFVEREREREMIDLT